MIPSFARWVIRCVAELEKRSTAKSVHLTGPGGPTKSTCPYLFRAVDSTGETIGFIRSPKRYSIGAKHFLQRALCERARFGRR
jgi:transposase-like protein